MRTSIATILAVALFAPGCATMLKSKSSEIAVSSATPGADVILNGTKVGVTPTKLNVSNKAHHVITVRASGKEEVCKLTSSASVGWIALDIATGGGWLVDLITHNWNNLDRTSCQVGI